MKRLPGTLWLSSDIMHTDIYWYEIVMLNSKPFSSNAKIFENGRLSHFVDGRGAPGNWMSLVKCARFPEEQNLIAVQCEGQIYYEACKEIRAGHELLVWYGDCYVQFLGIPLTLKDFIDGTEPLLTEGLCVMQMYHLIWFIRHRFIAQYVLLFKIIFANCSRPLVSSIQILERGLSVIAVVKCLLTSTTEKNTWNTRAAWIRATGSSPATSATGLSRKETGSESTFSTCMKNTDPIR